MPLWPKPAGQEYAIALNGWDGVRLVNRQLPIDQCTDPVKEGTVWRAAATKAVEQPQPHHRHQGFDHGHFFPLADINVHMQSSIEVESDMGIARAAKCGLAWSRLSNFMALRI